MINIDTWDPWVAIIFIGVPGLVAIAGIAHSLYLSRCRLDDIKKALKNSRYIYIWGPSLGKRGLIWSILEISKIAGMIVWPRASIIIGEINLTDLKHFPSHLKRHLMVNIILMFTALTWMIIVAILLKIR